MKSLYWAVGLLIFIEISACASFAGPSDVFSRIGRFLKGEGQTAISENPQSRGETSADQSIPDQRVIETAQRMRGTLERFGTSGFAVMNSEFDKQIALMQKSNPDKAKFLQRLHVAASLLFFRSSDGIRFLQDSSFQEYIQTVLAVFNALSASRTSDQEWAKTLTALIGVESQAWVTTQKSVRTIAHFRKFLIISGLLQQITAEKYLELTQDILKEFLSVNGTYRAEFAPRYFANGLIEMVNHKEISQAEVIPISDLAKLYGVDLKYFWLAMHAAAVEKAKAATSSGDTETGNKCNGIFAI